jgi:hypothetical protein
MNKIKLEYYQIQLKVLHFLFWYLTKTIMPKKPKQPVKYGKIPLIKCVNELKLIHDANDEIKKRYGSTNRKSVLEIKK